MLSQAAFMQNHQTVTEAECVEQDGDSNSLVMVRMMHAPEKSRKWFEFFDKKPRVRKQPQKKDDKL
jgi:hypothetical protein